MNPSSALAYHNAQLEASAFREEFDPEAFEDLTEPKYDMIHKVGMRPCSLFEPSIDVRRQTAPCRSQTAGTFFYRSRRPSK